MEIIANTTQFYLQKETAVAIGKFDGIHVGHRRLLNEILSRKKDGLAACVFTFDPLPAVVFGGHLGKEGGASALLTLNTRDEKRLLFERMGVDILIEFPLDRMTAAMPPETFVYEILAKQMNVRFLAAGKDLSFGAKGAGNAALLQKLGPQLGFDFMTIDKICMDGYEISSTLVRSKVEEGNMEMVEHLLGMPYMIVGRVVMEEDYSMEDGHPMGKGHPMENQIERTIGFHTISILPAVNKLLPPNGVYFSQVRYNGRGASHGREAFQGKLYRAISHVGYKSTVSDDHMMCVETYLCDLEEEIYGEEVEIYLCKFYRPEQRFDSPEMLHRQLKEDIAARNKENL